MIQPLHNYVLVERRESVSRSGLIIIPETAQEKSIIGTVLAVGPGKCDEDGIREPLDVKPGDIVYFNSKWSEFSGSHYSDEQLWDRRLHLVMEGDIYGRKTNGGAGERRGPRTSQDSRSGKVYSKRKAVKANHLGRTARHAATGV